MASLTWRPVLASPMVNSRISTLAVLSVLCTNASKVSIRRFIIMEKAPTRAFSWLRRGPNFMLRDRGVNAYLA